MQDMAPWPDEQVTMLSQRHPNWDIWYVRLEMPPGYLWCAKRKDHEVAELNAQTVELLDREMTSIERDQS